MMRVDIATPGLESINNVTTETTKGTLGNMEYITISHMRQGELLQSLVSGESMEGLLEMYINLVPDISSNEGIDSHEHIPFNRSHGPITVWRWAEMIPWLWS